ncbi:hypothetical protein IJ541_07945 [bacterium]|nr:hypothetical protein [bacterium]
MQELEKLANNTEIKRLIFRTTPIPYNNFGLRVEAYLSAGSYDFYFKNENNEENIIYLTSYVSDIFVVLKFLWTLAETKNPICTLIEGEGRNGIFYAKPISNNQVHFVVADDYELYKNFCKNNEHYSFEDAHICLDIVANKHRLIKRFYNAIWEETKNYKEIKYSPIWHGIEKRHIDLFEKLKKYIEDNEWEF